MSLKPKNTERSRSIIYLAQHRNAENDLLNLQRDAENSASPHISKKAGGELGEEEKDVVQKPSPAHSLWKRRSSLKAYPLA